MNIISNFQFPISNIRLNAKRYTLYAGRSRGFTLVELLIVIAIIGILSTVLMVNFVGIRERARDAKRKSDLRQMQSALELYRTDNSSYPVGSLNCGSPLEVGGKKYIAKIPIDPLSKSCYPYNSSDGVTYTYYACLENANDNEKDGTIFPNSGCIATYTVTNP